MTDTERVENCLELCRQARERHHHLETIEWKINFSIWTFLGAVAYFLATTKKEIGLAAFALMLVIPLHGIILSKLRVSQPGLARLGSVLPERSQKRTANS